MSYEEITIKNIIEQRGYRENIRGDKFSLYISNYPSNARYLRSRIGNSECVLAELCCSVGITLEYLAAGFKKVIGVDLDKDVLQTCKMNLQESGVFYKAELINGDVFDDGLLKGIEADVVIYDIPFWYPHVQENKGNLIDKNPPLKELIDKIRNHITSEIIIFAPAEWEYEYFHNELGALEYEEVFIDKKHDRNQIYLGKLVKSHGKTRIELKS